MSAGRYVCVAVAVALAVLHVARFDVPERPIVTDVRYYVYFATRTADGAVPHRDFFDNKPQLATFAGALFQTIGRPLGVDPLRAMRLGYLGLVALAGVLLFFVQRALRGGDCASGLLGVLCAQGFALLAFLPSIGPVPKLLMAVLALGAALLAFRGRWLAAGFAGGLATLDWQIGALAGLGILAAALCEPRDRGRAALAVVCGGLAALALFVVYFAWNGGLGEAFEQIVEASLARGSETARRGAALLRTGAIRRKIALACPDEQWLVWLGIAGMALYPVVLVRTWQTREARLAIPLAIYGYGIVAFSLADFQGFGDLMALLQVAALFAGVAASAILAGLRGLLGARAPASGRARVRSGALGAIAVVGFALAVGVGRDPVEPELPIPMVRPGVGLADQRDVARQLNILTAGRSRVFAGCAELIFLSASVNPLPFVFWNSASHSYFRAGPDERRYDSLERILRAQEVDAIVCAPPRVRRRLLKHGRYGQLILTSRSGRYRIDLLVARPGPAAMPPNG